MIKTACKPFQSLVETALIGLASILVVARLGHVIRATGLHAGLMQTATLIHAQPQA
jgi:hypothetical protein